MIFKRIMLCLFAATVAVLAGCATTSDEGMVTAGNAEQDQVIVEQKNRIQSLESELQTRERELANARQASSTQSGSAAAAAAAAGASTLFPPDAKPGRCYARVLIPATVPRRAGDRVAQGRVAAR